MDTTLSLGLLRDQLQQQTMLDWAITITAIAYVILAARESYWCWLWGIISCSLWAWVDFFRYNLWADGVLQVFYVVMGFWGLISWRGGKTGTEALEPAGKQLQIQSRPFNYHLAVVAAGSLLGLAMGYFFKNFTPAALPYPDSFITAFSLLTTVLTLKKVLENWLYWIVLDLAAVFLFLSREALLLALVMAIYAIISVAGYVNWRRRHLATLPPKNN